MADHILVSRKPGRGCRAAAIALFAKGLSENPPGAPDFSRKNGTVMPRCTMAVQGSDSRPTQDDQAAAEAPSGVLRRITFSRVL